MSGRSMTFIALMAVRELRASWRRLAFFFVCIAIGVAAIVSLRSVIQNVRGALTRETRALIASDILVTSNRPFDDETRALVAAERAAGRVTDVSEALEIATMVRPAARASAATKMVELRAVQPSFPYYGTLTLQEGAYRHQLLAGRGVLVRPELLAQLDLRVGDRLLIGSLEFEIRGVISGEPGRNLGAFSLGPRVLIDYADLESTGLLGFGSRSTRQILIKAPASTVRMVGDRLTEAFRNKFVRARGYWDNQDRVGENLSRAENYLSLVGLVILILGGIGVSSVTRVFVQQKVRSIAILKCLGGSSRTVLAVYLTQVVLLGMAGSLLGVALAWAVVSSVPLVPGVTSLMQVDYGLSGSAVAQGLAVGLLVSLLFAVVPLLDVRQVKPSLLLRHEASGARGVDWAKWAVAVAVTTALVGVAAWQAGSLHVGLLLSAGLVVTGAILHACGVVLVWAIQPLRFARSFALRQAVLHMVRPGNQTRVILLAVGLGAFFILGVRSLQVNLLRGFVVQAGPDAPDMFLVDVQPDQQADVTAYVDEANGERPAPRPIPVLRARVVAVKGASVSLENYEQVRGRSGLSREFTVTYRAEREANEELIAGRWWDSGTPGVEVSIEESLVERWQIGIGDEITFDVLGREITARVSSIRRVQWEDFRSGGFMFVFKPGTFEGAPHTYIATVRGPTDPAVRARLQAGLVSRFPNVSVIDMREILQTVRGLVDNVTMAVTVVGTLVLLSGALILVGAVAMTKFQRVYEAAILKTLGASRRLVATMLVLEYGALGAVAGTVGALGSVALSWSVARYALDLPWQGTPVLTLGGVAATAVLVAAIGVLASLDVLRHKPLATLRAE
jgi:putative ABC transport system permease protein